MLAPPPRASPATLRFYRILQRKCREFRTRPPLPHTVPYFPAVVGTATASSTTTDTTAWLLLQRPVDPQRDAGARILPQAADARPFKLLKLFTQLHQSSRYRQMTKRFNAGVRDDEESEEEEQQQQHMLRNWLYEISYGHDDLYDNGEYFEDGTSRRKGLRVTEGRLAVDHDGDTDDDDDDEFDDIGFSYDGDIASLWTSPAVLQAAIRHAFRLSPAPSKIQADGKVGGALSAAFTFSLVQYNQWAIQAYQLLNDQLAMHRVSSISECPQTHVRIVCTSRFMGRALQASPASSTAKASSSKQPEPFESDYHFAYRIRMENRGSETVQLLGRTWNIQEYHPDPADPANGTPSLKFHMKVDAPTQGAVGKLPVLQPGQAFEYMSGSALTTKSGIMSGYFHFAKVPANTLSALVSQHVEAFNETAIEKFAVPIEPFLLEAQDHDFLF